MKNNVTLAVVLAGALTVSGCATKKYVRNSVSPVDARLSQVEKTTTGHTSSINELENGVSRADERAQEANKNALAAGQSADRANQAASAAGQRADEARNMAQQATAKVGDLQHNLDTYDNFKVVADESVLFKFNSAELTSDAKQKLDQLAQNMTGIRRYIVEVTGYTDTVGSRRYNLALSERRADSVIRYLMLQHSVPLRNIHVIGLGKEAVLMQTANTADRADPNAPASPAGSNTKTTRKEARRVEIKLFAPEGTTGPSMQSRAASPQAQ
jgi:OmpA-OmpF porin, OOP family